MGNVNERNNAAHGPVPASNGHARPTGPVRLAARP